MYIVLVYDVSQEDHGTKRWSKIFKTCKRYLTHMSLTSDSINRNILECKCPDAHAALNFTFVLIETYWNVNPFTVTFSPTCFIVLIETYWNVNSFCTRFFSEPVYMY